MNDKKIILKLPMIIKGPRFNIVYIDEYCGWGCDYLEIGSSEHHACDCRAFDEWLKYADRSMNKVLRCERCITWVKEVESDSIEMIAMESKQEQLDRIMGEMTEEELTRFGEWLERHQQQQDEFKVQKKITGTEETRTPLDIQYGWHLAGDGRWHYYADRDLPACHHADDMAKHAHAVAGDLTEDKSQLRIEDGQPLYDKPESSEPFCPLCEVKADFDCDWVSAPTCPWCGEKNDDWWEYKDLQNDGDSTEIQCGVCLGTFHALMCVDVSFRTEKRR